MPKKSTKSTAKAGQGATKIEALTLPELDVLKTNASKGMPEAAASIAKNSCSTVS